MKKIALLIAFMAGLAAIAVAQPASMNYQGRLLDASGQPLANGSYTLEFNIYDFPNGGKVVWGPFSCDELSGDGHAAPAVVANGRFNVVLGPMDTSGRALTDVFQEDQRFVEITVDDGTPILPRQQFLSAPYALQSRRAQMADNATTAANAQHFNNLPPVDYFLPPGMVVPFAGPTDRIPEGWLLCDGSAVGNAVYPRLFAAIGTAWGDGTYHQGVEEAPANPDTDFNVPDLRGMFLRGVNLSRSDDLYDPEAEDRSSMVYPGQNTGDSVGSVQTSDYKKHDHIMHGKGGISYQGYDDWYLSRQPTANGSAGGRAQYGIKREIDDNLLTGDAPKDPAGGLETRPNNAYVNYIIKY